MVPWGWKEVAAEVAPDHPRRVSRFIFSLQAAEESHFFLEHNRDAVDLLNACIAADAGGVWDEMRTVLETNRWVRFSIGFPKSLLRALPPAPIMQWVEADPTERAGILAHFLAPTFLTDQDLDSQLVDRYGPDRGVPGVRTWANEARQSLLEMEIQERGREADDAIRRG
jgi:hypothetical protein